MEEVITWFLMVFLVAPLGVFLWLAAGFVAVWLWEEWKSERRYS